MDGAFDWDVGRRYAGRGLGWIQCQVVAGLLPATHGELAYQGTVDPDDDGQHDRGTDT